jgi:hypothetical protein
MNFKSYFKRNRDKTPYRLGLPHFFYLPIQDIRSLLFKASDKHVFSYPGGTQPNPGILAPIITRAFAGEKDYYGVSWKINLEAE